MKKETGPKLALYPMPVALVGAMNGDKPTWTTVAHMGIVGHDQVLVSLADAHFINGAIKRTGRLSLNLVSEQLLPEVDVAGSVSGAKTDKSDLLAYTVAPNGAPLAADAPLSMACTVRDVYRTHDFESFVCGIDATYVDERCVTEKGSIDYGALKPVLFDFPNYEYLRTGEVIGKCLSFKRAEA